MNMSFLNRVNLQKAVFNRARLDFADLSYSNLEEAVFDGTGFHRTKVHHVLSDTAKIASRSGVYGTDKDLSKAELWII
jgi:uncharacterized protein YjbI with pentapeptide repeats